MSRFNVIFLITIHDELNSNGLQEIKFLRIKIFHDWSLSLANDIHALASVKHLLNDQINSHHVLLTYTLVVHNPL